MNSVGSTRLSARSKALILFLFSFGALQAQEPAIAPKPDKVLVRLFTDGGQVTVDKSHHGSTESGADLMFSLDDHHRFGLRVSSLDINAAGKHQRYLVTGFVFETVMFNWLRTEIGTAGFVGRGENSGTNPFGLVSFLGYEKRLGRLNLSIGYEGQVIFTHPATQVRSIRAGLGAHF